MRTLVMIATLALFSMASTAAVAGDNNFVKGTKSYQKSSSSSDDAVVTSGDEQASATNANPQDISPAAGAEEEAQPSTKEVMVESMKLPRK